MDVAKKEKILSECDRFITHILQRNFAWAYKNQGTGSNLRMRRALDRADLVQEAKLAAWEALDNYDADHASEAVITTYLYQCIRNRLNDYCAKCFTPLKVGMGPRALKSKVKETRLAAEAAFGYQLFSDLDMERTSPDGDTHEVEFQPVPPGDPDDYDPAIQAERRDEIEHQINKIRYWLSSKDYEILLDFTNGMTITQLAAKLGMTRAKASKRISEIMETARSAVDDDYGKCGYSNST